MMKKVTVCFTADATAKAVRGNQTYRYTDKAI